jgi:hypothetical protein
MSSIEEQFINMEEEKENLWKMTEQQYKGDIQNYIVKVEDLNYQFCLFRIEWQEVLHIDLIEDIKD